MKKLTLLLLFFTACTRPPATTELTVNAEPTPRPFAPTRALTKLNIDPTTITVSGVSSGAFMGVQLHVAHSDIISGVGAIAGGIYSCSEGQVATAITTCMSFPGTINSNKYINIAKQNEKGCGGERGVKMWGVCPQ
jgi:poly(3-hydroxybutyrate) depolymerase